MSKYKSKNIVIALLFNILYLFNKQAYFLISENMIFGIGVDIVDINSFTESFNKSKRFRQRVFTENEIEYCESKPNKYQHYAARFAAKEAVMKAIGTGWDQGIQWKEIETININGEGKEEMQTVDRILGSDSGKPEVRLNGKALERIKDLGGDSVLISLSHSETQAVAFVILENKK